MGMIRVRNAETGERMWVDSSSRRVRENYQQWFDSQSRYLNETFLKSGVDAVKIRTDQDYVKPLLNLFNKRGARR
jgi:hypothetical protein